MAHILTNAKADCVRSFFKLTAKSGLKNGDYRSHLRFERYTRTLGSNYQSVARL
jgi:hypothetical protein